MEGFPPTPSENEGQLGEQVSPDHLEHFVATTTLQQWVALVAVCSVIMTALVWSVFGSLSITVKGEGILVSEGLFDVQAGSAGEITQIHVKPGESVKKGQEVAKLRLKDLEDKISLKKALREDLVKRRDGFGGTQINFDEAKEKAISSLNKQIERLAREPDGDIALARKTLEDAVANKNRQEPYHRQRLIPEAQWSATLAAETQARLLLGTLLNQVRGAKAEIRAWETRSGNSRAEFDKDIDALAKEESDLRRKLESSGSVCSPVDGTVIDVVVEPNTQIAYADARIMIIEPLHLPMEAVVYVQPRDAAKIRVDSSTRAYPFATLSPANARPEEYGVIVARVSSKQEFPASPEGMDRVLRNQVMVNQLSEEAAPHEVRIKPEYADISNGKFRWRGLMPGMAKGPDFPIFSGTPCTARIQVEKKRPIDYVIPPRIAPMKEKTSPSPTPAQPEE